MLLSDPSDILDIFYLSTIYLLLLYSQYFGQFIVLSYDSKTIKLVLPFFFFF